MTSPVLEVDPRSAIDLSFRIDPAHFRWGGDRVLSERLDDGAPFSTTRFGQSAHAFTHADAPSHVMAKGTDLADLPLSTWVGTATVIDVSSCADDAAITADTLERTNTHVEADEILLVRTDWDRRRDIADASYWAESPWLDRSAAEWLHERRPRAVGFDFPQDAAIRRAVAGERPAPEDFVTHDVLLRHGIGLIEYLRGLDQIGARALLVAAPIALERSDGGPSRAVAFPLRTEKTPHTAATAAERSS